MDFKNEKRKGKEGCLMEAEKEEIYNKETETA